MYRTLKNMLRRSARKRGRVKWHSQGADTESNILQVIESSQCQNYTYLNMSEDLGHLEESSSGCTPNSCSPSDLHSSSSRTHGSGSRTHQFDTVAEVHFTENVEPVTAIDMSPKVTSDLLNVSQHKLQNMGPDDNPQSSFDPKSPPKGSEEPTNPFEKVADFFQQFNDLRTDVRIMMANQSLVYLLGTNHADPQCPIDVSNIIKKIGPELVIVELCAWRACGCDLHRGNVFQSKPEFTFHYLRKVISQIGFLPAMIFFTDAFNEHHAVTNELLDYGGEFAVAARLCEELGNCKILLGDREIPITVKRQASGMGNWRGIRISILVTLALIFKRRMKMLLLRGHQLVIRDPRFYQVVVLERDIFLAYMIQVAAALKHDTDQTQIVAVVGQGHLNGIQRFWGRILPQILPIILKPELDF